MEPANYLFLNYSDAMSSRNLGVSRACKNTLVSCVERKSVTQPENEINTVAKRIEDIGAFKREAGYDRFEKKDDLAKKKEKNDAKDYDTNIRTALIVTALIIAHLLLAFYAHGTAMKNREYELQIQKMLNRSMETEMLLREEISLKNQLVLETVKLVDIDTFNRFYNSNKKWKAVIDEMVRSIKTNQQGNLQV